MSIPEIWKKIDKWLAETATAVFDGLAQRAESQDVSPLENEVGFAIPDHLRQALSVHDGESEDEAWVFANWALLSALEIADFHARENQRQIEQSTVTVDSDARIQSIVWANGWVPFAYDGSGGFLAVDCCPTSCGQSGQIIRTAHDDGNGWVASSLEGFLVRFYDALDGNKFEYEDDEFDVRTGFSNWWKADE